MRYQSEDGEVFDTELECRKHEEGLGVQAVLRAEAEAYVDSFLDELEEGLPEGSERVQTYNGRSRTRKIAEVMGWISYDLGLHPERYSLAPAVGPVGRVVGEKSV